MGLIEEMRGGAGSGDPIQIGWVVPLNLLTTVVAKRSHVKKND